MIPIWNSLKIIICLILLGQSAYALDHKYCYIKDAKSHKSNQKLLNDILKKNLSKVSDLSPKEQADYLSTKISEIATSLLKNGFSLSAYDVPEIDSKSIACFQNFALWEGEKNDIPLTFFVYVWPSEEFALKYLPFSENRAFASNIHKHPIPCAFAVLQGTIVESTFDLATSDPKEKKVHLIHQKVFKEGEGERDDLKVIFIHQLFGRCPTSKVCLSLHAYGLPSAEKVMQCFHNTLSECSYERVF